MQPISEYKLTGFTVKQYDGGTIIQKGKDIVFLNEEQFEVLKQLINSLVKEQ